MGWKRVAVRGIFRAEFCLTFAIALEFIARASAHSAHQSGQNAMSQYIFHEPEGSCKGHAKVGRDYAWQEQFPNQHKRQRGNMMQYDSKKDQHVWCNQCGEK